MSAIQNEYQELLADIQYLEYLVTKDKESFKASLKDKLSNAVSVDTKADLILDELSMFAGKISARAAVIEKNLGISTNLEPDLPVREDQAESSIMSDNQKLSIVDVGRHNRLGYVHHTGDNTPYCFVAPETKLVADLYVNRSNPLTLAVNTPVFSDTKLLKQIKIEIDGVPLKHKVANIEGIQRIICHIPNSKSSDKTHLAVIFPPADENASYKLGVSDIHCVQRQTVKKFLRKKLGN